MPTGAFTKSLQKIGQGSIDWENDTFVLYAIDEADYTVDLTNHEFLSSVAAGARVASATMANTLVSATGLFTADDTTLLAVSGDSFEAILIVKDTGVEATSPLIFYFDNSPDLPATPIGEDVVVSFQNGLYQL